MRILLEKANNKADSMIELEIQSKYLNQVKMDLEDAWQSLIQEV